MSRRRSVKRGRAVRPHASVAGRRGSAKRAFDVVVSAVALVALSPLLAAIAALVALTSRGPVLYRQRRLGLGGITFDIVKFRTMLVDAEPDGRPVWAEDEDLRCTRVGATLRRYGLDELPQLWNVLRGEMSLVGPRPERPEFAREFARRWPRFHERLAVRGGITGLAQVEGFRGDTHVGRRLERDLSYVAEWSLAGDLRLLVRTIPAVLSRRRSGRDRRLADALGAARSADGD
jgi:lipopolysaccharide/colanic/teichoic acid biosynthesis glycosyltransferase